jgi:hypothetical protein
MRRSVIEAIAMPVRFEATDRIQPWVPPPTMTNEAQAMKVTQTGRGTTTAVSQVSTAPSTPMLIVRASICFTTSFLRSSHRRSLPAAGSC